MAKRDRWVEKYEREAYEGTNFKRFEAGCRPATSHGVLQCQRPIVRQERCILHAPKLTTDEKRDLSRDEQDQEREFEEEFKTALRLEADAMFKSGSGLIRFAAIQFPSIDWNQPPWREILGTSQIDFTMAVFHSEANFPGIVFSHEPWFTRTVFRDRTSFNLTTFRTGARFIEAVFENDVSFQGTMFQGWCNFARSRFERNVDFSWAKMHGRVWFKGTDECQVFEGLTCLHRLELGPEADVSFESASLKGSSFLHTDFESLHLSGITWNRPESRHFSRMSRRRVLSDEAQLHSDSAADLLDAIADNYRQLVLNYERKRDFDSAEDFHIGEMEVRRLATAAHAPLPFRRAVRYLNAFTLYRCLSAYGSSYWQALTVLLMMLILASILFMFTGLRSVQSGPDYRSQLLEYHIVPRAGDHRPSLEEIATDYAAALEYTLSVMTFQRERSYRPANRSSRAFESLFTVFFTGQTGLLLLAIRRRFRRE